jgi:drug/metabolite transporter (DMT)-like permease
MHHDHQSSLDVHDRRRHPAAVGRLLCLASAVCFAALGIFGKLAYDAGVTVATLLSVRFAIAAAVLGALLALRPASRARLARRTLLVALGLGAVGYATQAGLFFGALQRMDVSLLSLLLYTYPAMVTLAAVALGRERPGPRTWLALGAASAGVALVLAGAGAGSFDALGAAMGLGAALAYTAYIVVADAEVGGVPPVPLTALVLAGAAVTCTAGGAATGGLDLGFAAGGWLWLALMALVSTVAAAMAFFAGLRRVGPSAAAILSTFEPPVTVGLAALAFGERLAPAQLAGGALVLSAIVLLHARVPGRATPRAAGAAQAGTSSVASTGRTQTWSRPRFLASYRARSASAKTTS